MISQHEVLLMMCAVSGKPYCVGALLYSECGLQGADSSNFSLNSKASTGI